MHTLIATAAGLLSLAVILGIGKAFGAGNWSILVTFLGLSFVGAFIHGAIGVREGQSVLTECLVFLVVFGVPAALAIALYYRQS